ncbi:MAG TPA: hypothetical protein VNG69_05165 [Casimicrobiaceae bacterium]|nr:hypothetical protein [Casimicrobiaceae bacterium]
MVFAVAWTLALGKDLQWDAVNYHLYAGFSAIHDRFSQDFFGAGTPSYVNPYALVPLYWMWSAAWPAIAMGIVFAVFHALVLGLTFELAMVAGIRRHQGERRWFAFLALLLAAINPVLLQGLGSTASDLSVTVVALGGWVAVARVLRGGDWRMAALAGALCGFAAALKLSNAIFAIAAFAALILMPGTLRARGRGLMAFLAACAVAFVVVSLPWSWPLWREFGNPFFPFLNEHFRSPDFITTPIRQERFIPLTWDAFVARPFDMLRAASGVHVEPRAPDLRYAALILALGALGAARLSRAFRRISDGATTDDPGSYRCLAGLVIGFVVSWCLWLAISGNSRYFLPMACATSVILALVLQRLYLKWQSATIAGAVLIVSMQVVQLVLGSDLVRGGMEWKGPWVRVEIPDRLRQEPYFFVAPGFQSGSFFLPYLHPESGMMNVGGFYVIGPRQPGGERAQRLLDSNSSRLRMLLPLPDGVVTHASLPRPPEDLRLYFRRFGLRIDRNDCEFLRIEGNIRGERRRSNDGWKHFISCRLLSAPEERLAYEAEVKQVELLFDRVEDTCPKLFFPPRPVTQEFHYWSRAYQLGSEMQLFIDEGRIKYFSYMKGGDAIDIGSVEEWRKAPQSIDCTVRFKPGFGIPL